MIMHGSVTELEVAAVSTVHYLFCWPLGKQTVWDFRVHL